jgi:hypothetical protein
MPSHNYMKYCDEPRILAHQAPAARRKPAKAPSPWRTRPGASERAFTFVACSIDVVRFEEASN